MEPKTDTLIQFSGLKCGSYDYQFKLGKSFFSSFENENLNDGNVIFDVKLEKNEHYLMFYFSFSGQVKTTCDRCLGEIEVPVTGTQTLCVKFSDDEVSDNEDVLFLPTNEYKIDLAQWMYEYVVIAMPMQCIHPDDENGNPTCDPEMLKYISPEQDKAASQDANEEETDPRWDALKNLK